MRCVPPAVAMLEDLREKTQLRERQKHVIAADDRGIAREDQEETSTRRDLSLEQGARGVTAKRGDELIGVDVVCIEQSRRPQREQRTRDDDREHDNDHRARRHQALWSTHRRGELRDALEARERQECPGVPREESDGADPRPGQGFRDCPERSAEPRMDEHRDHDGQLTAESHDCDDCGHLGVGIDADQVEAGEQHQRNDCEQGDDPDQIRCENAEIDQP